MGMPALKSFVMNLRFPGHGAPREALRRIEAVSGLTIVRGRITAGGARLEVVRTIERK